MKTNAMKTLAAAALALAGLSLGSARAAMPRAGDRAPLVQGTDQDGRSWKLSDQIGKKIILLYFYPKDQTPGCTKEACGFRDNITELEKQNVQVIGVSFDSGASHQKFIARYHLNFPLIADTSGAIADAYGVRAPGRNMDRRVSFLIGLDGRIVHVTNSPNPDVHLSEMKKAVSALKG